MSLRHRRRQLKNLLQRLDAEIRGGPDPLGGPVAWDSDLTWDHFHEVELDRCGELLRRRAINERGQAIGSYGNHSPTNPLEGCECGICQTPTEPLTEREQRELATYVRMAFTETRPPSDEPWEPAYRRGPSRWGHDMMAVMRQSRKVANGRDVS